MSQPSSRLRSLDVLGGPGKGSSCAVGPEDDELLIGSDGACQLRLASPGVSPIHARVVIEGESASVLDTRSPKGLYVNDDRVVGEAAIREGDILWLGPPGDAASVMILVRFGPVAAPPSLPPAPAKAPRPPTAVPAPVVPPVVPPVAPVEHRVAVSAAQEPVPFALDAPPERGAAPGDEFAFGEAPPLAGADRAGAVDDGFFVSEAGVPGPPPGDEALAPAAPTSESDGFFVADDAAPDFAAAADSFFIDEATPSAAPEVPAPPQPVAAPQAPRPEVAAPKELPRPAAPTLGEPARRAATAPATQARPPRPAVAPRRTGVSSAPRGRAGGPAWGMWVVLGALGLLLVGGGVFAVLPFLRGPVIRELSPGRVGVGQTVILGGSGFGASPAENTVRFGPDREGTVVAASSTRLAVEVPEVATVPGRDLKLPVTVSVGARTSAERELTVYQTPRIHGLAPDVAMPGEEITLAGAGWTQGAKVQFGGMDAEIITLSDRSIRVRVPQIEGGAGTAVPVTVIVGSEMSNSGPFVVGHLPLISAVEPNVIAPGAILTVRGRGFSVLASANIVAVGGARALVGSATESELKVAAPRQASEGPTTAEVRVPRYSEIGSSPVNVAPLPELAELRFFAERLDEDPSDAHAIVASYLGSVVVLSASGGRSAAERAVEVQAKLNAAAEVVSRSPGADFEVRDLPLTPRIAVTGQGDTILEVTAEDAAGYDQEWNRGRGRGGPATPDRVARWVAAILKDHVLMLARGEKPHHASDLAPEGRPLGELYQAALKAGSPRIPHKTIASTKPPLREGLRTLGLRIPAAVKAIGGLAAPTGPTSAAPAFKMQGTWSGSEVQAGSRRYITVTFQGNGGTFTIEGAVALQTALALAEQPQKGTVRFAALVRGGTRYYLGKWDGERISGTIAKDAAGREEVGTFELTFLR
jgi:hypothetical protein